jgi:5-methylcytosine-specific restriction endonuclease McrA
MADLSGSSLGDYGAALYEKYHFTCVYCGFDGRTFDSWMQLSIDHVLPKASGGSDQESNKVVCCRACNSITSRMTFDKDMKFEDIIQYKRNRVAERRREFYKHWLDHVAPKYLSRPLPPIMPTR